MCCSFCLQIGNNFYLCHSILLLLSCPRLESSLYPCTWILYVYMCTYMYMYMYNIVMLFWPSSLFVYSITPEMIGDVHDYMYVCTCMHFV